MQLGAYIDGRPLNFDENRGTFDISGAPVTAEEVKAWDAAQQIVWASDAAKVEFTRLSLMTAPATTTAPSKAGLSVKVIAILAILGLCVVCGLVNAITPSDDDSEPVAAEQPEAPESEPATEPEPVPQEQEQTAEEPASTLDELRYRDSVAELTRDLGGYLGDLGPLLQSPRFGQDDWTISVVTKLVGITAVADEARALTPPPGFEEIHGKWMEAVEGYDWVANNLPAAIDNFDADLMDECLARLLDANESLEEATALAEARQ